MPSIDHFITGGAEGDSGCDHLTWGILIVVVLLLLNAIGTINLKSADKYAPKTTMPGSTQQYQISTQADVAGSGREGFPDDTGIGGIGTSQTGPNFLSGADDSVSAAIDAEDASAVVTAYAASGAASAGNAAAAKGAWLGASAAAGADMWARFGGENSCDLPVNAGALAEGLSLTMANGDMPTM